MKLAELNAAPRPRRRTRIRAEEKRVHPIACPCHWCSPPMATEEAGYGRAFRWLVIFMIGATAVTTVLSTARIVPSPLVIFGALR